MDLDALERGGPSGAVWSLEGSDDLNANLVVLAPGAKIDTHVNREVEVLYVVLDGTGVLVVDGVVWHLHAHVSVLVPKGAQRKLTATGGVDEADDVPLRYLTVHRRRGGLQIGRAGAAVGARTVVDRRAPMPNDATHHGAEGAPPPECPAH